MKVPDGIGVTTKLVLDILLLILFKEKIQNPTYDTWKKIL